ncbi:sulfatase [Haloferula sp. A504]|uniref:sulfatase n=1 Tax=Haloferula sp. A504 TaxID=3373601 RepID=UPI0031C730CC|nr:sulfatase [Verrucomicrobiaceae bacterium E54]
MKPLLLAGLALFLPLQAETRRPNFVFIYTDDQRWDAFGTVQREQGERARFPWFETPGMDRLAREGVRFDNAFVTLSLCSPSRASFLTGAYNHMNGVKGNSTPFPADAVTHASVLRENGYRTAYFGKWHMGKQRERPGFDHAASFVGQGIYFDCPFVINGEDTPTEGWVDDVSTDFAIDWMRAQGDRPFSLVLGFKSPHTPRGGKNLPDRLRDLYAGEKSRTTPNANVPPPFAKPNPETGKYWPGLADNDTHLDYLRHVKGADENLGRILDALDELKIADDTVVVYSSDNGYYLGEHCSGDKRMIYEEALRVPYLVRYPRLFKAGQVVDGMVLNIDLAPTFLSLAGVAVPESMQGRDWSPLAKGDTSNWRSSFLAQYYKEMGNVPTLYGLRTDHAKLIEYPGHSEWTEAFDLGKDPYEIRNLADEESFMGPLRDELAKQVKAMRYPIPEVKP